MPRARLGVILALPPPLAAEVDGLRRAVGDVEADRVPPHVTLVPPVNVATRALDAALAIARDAAAGSPPVPVVLGPPATFWPATPVVYLSVGGDVDGVRRLHDAFDGGPWERPTTWPFVPHVTIAPDISPGLIPAALQVLARYRREATLTTLQVMREEPDRSWKLLTDAALSGRRIVGRGGLEVVLDAGATLDAGTAGRLTGGWGDDGVPFAISARREGDLVGGAAGTTAGRELWLHRLSVDPAVRGAGVGRHLLRAVEALGTDRACSRAFALCPAASAGAGWLSAHGWRPDLDLPAWSDGRAFVRMVRDLPSR